MFIRGLNEGIIRLQANHTNHIPAFQYAIDTLGRKLEKVAKMKKGSISGHYSGIPIALEWCAHTNIAVAEITLHAETNFSFRVALEFGTEGEREKLAINGSAGSFAIDCSGGREDIFVNIPGFPDSKLEPGNRFKTEADEVIDALIVAELEKYSPITK